MRYDAFISYSHGVDGEQAEALQEGLVRFAKPWYRRRALSIFRDTTGLSANPGLWSAITGVMRDSEYFVVLCSPDAAASPWVGREIEHWKATKPPGRLLPVLTAGELVWDDAAGRLDPAQSTAAHPALLEAFDEEPLYVDVRNTEGELTLRNPAFKDNVAALAAPMHGVSKDELVGEDIRQHRRTLRFAWGAAIAMLLLTIATAVGATIAVRNAELARRTAEEKVEVESRLREKRAELVALNRTYKRRQAELASAQDELKDAKALTVAAEQETADAKQATAAAEQQTVEAQQATAAAEQATAAAEQEEEAAKALAASARKEADENDKKAKENGALAAANLKQAEENGQLAADNRDKFVENRKKATANGKKATTNAKKATANGKLAVENAKKAADADASLQATRLTNAAVNAERMSNELDLSLLLAVEASMVEPEKPPALGASVFTPDHEALDRVLDAAENLDRFLRFRNDEERPASLGAVAVSPDGRFIAAAEEWNRDSVSETRLYVWDLAGPEPVKARMVGTGLGCVTELRWTSANILLSVDYPGCIAEIVYEDPITKIQYVKSSVYWWIPPTGDRTGWAQGPAEVPGEERAFGYSPYLGSPLSLSPDGRFGVITYDRGVRIDEQGAVAVEGEPLVFSILLDSASFLSGSTIKLAGVFAKPGSLAFANTFSPNGRFVAAFDQLTRSMGIWDFGKWIEPGSPRAVECLLPLNGCFEQVVPVHVNDVPATIGGSLAFAPGGAREGEDRSSTFMATLREESADNGPPPLESRLRFFDALTGAEIENSGWNFTGVVRGIAFNGSLGAVVDVNRDIYLVDLGTSAQKVGDLPASGANCNLSPAFGAGGKLLFVHKVCSQGPAQACSIRGQGSTLVIDVASGQFLAEVPGVASYTGPEDLHVVVQRRPPADTSCEVDASRVGFQIWEFARDGSGGMIDAGTDAGAIGDGYSMVAAVHRSNAGSDFETRVWKLGGEDVDQVSLAGSKKIKVIAFAPGNRLVGFGAMGAGVIWNLGSTAAAAEETIDQLRERACKLAGRNLTEDEFRQYVGDGDYRKTCPEIGDATVGTSPTVESLLAGGIGSELSQAAAPEQQDQVPLGNRDEPVVVPGWIPSAPPGPQPQPAGRKGAPAVDSGDPGPRPVSRGRGTSSWRTSPGSPGP